MAIPMKKLSDAPVLDKATDKTYLLLVHEGAAYRIPFDISAFLSGEATLNLPKGNIISLHISTNSLEATQITTDDFRATEVVAKEMYADNMPFEKIVGTADNPIVLRNLTKNGTYYLMGKFKHHEADKVSSLVEGFYIVKWMKDASYIVRHSANDTGIRYYTIHDDSYIAKQFNHADITVAIERISALEKRVEALDGKVEEYHAPVFYIDGVEYKFEIGMNLESWANSDYNTDGWQYIDTHEGFPVLTTDELMGQGKGVPMNWDEIELGAKYTTSKYADTFTINGVEYMFERGMTWQEWCHSDYNEIYAEIPYNASGIGSAVNCEDETYVVNQSGEVQHGADVIIENHKYTESSAENYIKFCIFGHWYLAERDMTWGDWCDSKFDTADTEEINQFYIYGDYFVADGDAKLCDSEGNIQMSDTVIVDREKYTVYREE